MAIFYQRQIGLACFQKWKFSLFWNCGLLGVRFWCRFIEGDWSESSFFCKELRGNEWDDFWQQHVWSQIQRNETFNLFLNESIAVTWILFDRIWGQQFLSNNLCANENRRIVFGHMSSNGKLTIIWARFHPVWFSNHPFRIVGNCWVFAGFSFSF